jgi:PAP_fibrillin
MRVQLLSAAAKVQRGLTASNQDRENIDRLAQSLEKINPNRKSLSAPQINGRWKLVYTTSDSILGTKRAPFLRPIGPIYQTIGAAAHAVSQLHCVAW